MATLAIRIHLWLVLTSVSAVIGAFVMFLSLFEHVQLFPRRALLSRKMLNTFISIGCSSHHYLPFQQFESSLHIPENDLDVFRNLSLWPLRAQRERTTAPPQHR